ncbi:hybrid-cluster NAD(P)-dependent oxidoreductase [Nocardioides baekrokdamisoli]|uniref:Hybrid-cluster NAD(P)-dependent oxidoreductase n=1 Tax=Nocardioides baekrokdamisoli TaxID=1804624 RepID=A0A3G9IQB1_9ACTN|nr:iron-sulfur cluster-binding domain-containing protein [Nocardioides baekrokdamisoli]BBH15801.1 hybrid-cluster NAD(P)-dependent oxidoreductase [Nocardioides baekrokdamisoli]
MTLSTSPYAPAKPERIRGLEMPWNRALGSSSTELTRVLAPGRPQEFTAECVEVIPEVGDMKTFVFRRTDGAPLSFRAGQYLNIAFPVDGPDAEPVDRSYSISSPPTRPWTFSISVKRDPEGQVSRWAHDHLVPGMLLEMLGPVGAFHLPDSDRRARYLLLAAGSGITPLMSMIRTIHDLPGRVDVVLLYHAAQAGTFTFAQELEQLAAADSRIKVFWSLGDRNVPDTWAWLAGRPSTQMLNEVAPDANGRQVYACGPAGYLEAVQRLVRDVGVDDTSFNMEYFTGDRQTLLEYDEEIAYASQIAADGPATDAADLYGPTSTFETDLGAADVDQLETEPDAAPAVSVDPSDFATVGTGSLTLSFVRSKLNVRIDPDEAILGVAQRNGVRISANCQEGMCGSCKSLKLSGEVEMNHQGGIRAREIAAGKFLPCCSTAKTDLLIDA